MERYQVSRRKVLGMGLSTAALLVGCNFEPASSPDFPINAPLEPLEPLRHELLQIAALSDTPISRENTRPGTTNWVIPIGQRPLNREIEGYASATSVNRGGTLHLYVSCKDPSFDIEVYRLGYYGGAGARLVTAQRGLAGQVQTTPGFDSNGLIECNWALSSSIVCNNPSDSSDWWTGFYLIKLISSSGKQNYIPFVVRDDSAIVDFLVQSSVSTELAYNCWGGKSIYGWYGFDPIKGGYTTPLPDKATTAQYKANVVSLDRPIDMAWSALTLRYEYPMIRFLEREGYNTAYFTNIDLHANPGLLNRGKVFVSLGHDEYWSKPMRDGVEAARNAGKHLAFFSANTCYWQVRFQSSAGGTAYRRMVCYWQATKDPLYPDALTTTRWRDYPINRAEINMMGVMYGFDVTNQAKEIDRKYPDAVVANAGHWMFSNTGLKNGDALWGLVGYEADIVFSEYNVPGRTELFRSPVKGDTPFGLNQQGVSSAVLLETSGRGTVFASGSFQFQWGLDERPYTLANERSDLWLMNQAWNRNYYDPRMVQICKNLFNRFAGISDSPLPSSNLLLNPNFEAGNAAWGGYAGGYSIDVSGGRNGGQALKLVNPGNGVAYGAGQQINLNQTTVKPIYFCGYSKASGVSGSTDINYSIYLDIAYKDGTYLFGQTLKFATGSHDWQFLETTIQPTKLVSWVRYYCLLRPPHTGTAWFDDLCINQMGSTVSPPPPPAPPSPPTPTTSNLVQNPGFEAGNTAWGIFGGGYTIDTTGGRNGGQALKLINPGNGVAYGAIQQINLNQNSAKPIYFCGYSKAQGVSGSPDANYCVYLDIGFTDGTYLFGQTLRYATGSHDWQFLEATVQTAKPIAWVRYYCLLRPAHAGTVWFDDLTLREA